MPTINDVKRDAILFILGGLVSVTDDINYLEYRFWQFVLGGGLTGGTPGVADPLANGIVVRTGLGTSAARTISGSAPVQIVNGDGVAGNPTIDIDIFTSIIKGLVPGSGGGSANFLRADGTWSAPPGGGGGLPDPGANGIVSRTALNTDVARAIIAGSTKVAITNGDGVAGNPSVDVTPSNFTGIPESGVTNLVADLAAKALDTAVVHNTGAETIAGVKTFSSTIAGSINGNAATVTTVPSLSGDISNVGNSLTVVNGAISNAKLANMAANTFKANNTGAPAAPNDITVAQAKTLLAITSGDVSGLGALATKSNVDLSTADATGILAAGRFPALTGDVTTVAGALASTITSGVVSNAKLATMSANSIKGNNTGAVAAPVDLTGAQATALLSVYSTSAKGVVPPPATALGTTFLRDDNVWATPAGAGGSITVVTGNVDFGTSVGGEETTALVTLSTPTITAGSKPIPFVHAVATADHDPDDYAVAELIVVINAIVAATSVDLLVSAPDGAFGLFTVGVGY